MKCLVASLETGINFAQIENTKATSSSAFSPHCLRGFLFLTGELSKKYTDLHDRSFTVLIIIIPVFFVNLFLIKSRPLNRLVPCLKSFILKNGKVKSSN